MILVLSYIAARIPWKHSFLKANFASLFNLGIKKSGVTLWMAANGYVLGVFHVVPSWVVFC